MSDRGCCDTRIQADKDAQEIRGEGILHATQMSVFFGWGIGGFLFPSTAGLG